MSATVTTPTSAIELPTACSDDPPVTAARFTAYAARDRLGRARKLLAGNEAIMGAATDTSRGLEENEVWALVYVTGEIEKALEECDTLLDQATAILREADESVRAAEKSSKTRLSKTRRELAASMKARKAVRK